MHAFRAHFFLEWGGETHVFCKVLRTKPHWFSGKIVGLIGLIGLVRLVGLVGLVGLVRLLGQLGLACSINPLTSKTAFERLLFRRPLTACMRYKPVQTQQIGLMWLFTLLQTSKACTILKHVSLLLRVIQLIPS